MIGQPVFKQLRFKRQTAKGTIATTTAGQILRRDSSSFELQKDTYDTNDEQNSAQQMQSFSHGPKKVAAAIKALLSPGTYSDLVSALLRRDYAAVTAITGLSMTIAASGSFYTITRGAGSWLTDGIKVGMVGRLTAGTFNANNLNKNFQVVDMTALALTVRVLNNLTMTAEGPIAGGTFTVPGKVTYAANSGHTNIYYTFEEWYSDIAQSERSQDVQIGQASLTIPGSGNASIEFSGEGLDQTQGAAAYFTAPSSESTTDVCSGATGALTLNGAVLATVTNLSYTINGQVEALEGVVGTNVRPDVGRDKVLVQGSVTLFFEDYTVPSLFTGENEFTLVHATTAGAGAAAEFFAGCLPRVKLSSMSPDEGGKALKRTYNFSGIYNVNGGSGVKTEKTTIQLHDSAAS